MPLKDRDREKWVRTARDWKPPRVQTEVFLGSPVESDLQARAFSAKDNDNEWLEIDIVVDLDEAE